MPSNLFHEGAYAKDYVKASGQNYANSSQKEKLKEIFQKSGCHHCGKCELKFNFLIYLN